MDERPVVARISRWEWDSSAATIERVLERARVVTWVSAVVLGAVLVGVGWVLTTGILHWSAVIYGALGGVAGGYLVRGVYVALRVRHAVAAVKAAIVPAAVDRATEAQLAALVVNGGSRFDPYIVLRVEKGEALVEITRSDLADRPMHRPGFLQLLLTGPDGVYYDDGHGTWDGSGSDGGDGDGGGFDGGGFDGGGVDGGGGGS